MNRPLRLVVTGGPGGGKTSAVERFVKQPGNRVVALPEVATLMFGSGFPRSTNPAAVHIIQRTFFQVQHNLEDLFGILHPGQIHLCDRGTVDGAAYWPAGPNDFFIAQQTSLAAELARYDAVLFFETAALSATDLKSNNHVRDESQAEAIAIDQRLRSQWSQHPNFSLIPCHLSFEHKITQGLDALQSLVSQLASP